MQVSILGDVFSKRVVNLLCIPFLSWGRLGTRDSAVHSPFQNCFAKPSMAAAASSDRQDHFAKSWAKTEQKLNRCNQTKQGCLWCLGQCFLQFGADRDELHHLRQQLNALNKDQQDVQLAWLFQFDLCSGLQQGKAKAKIVFSTSSSEGEFLQDVFDTDDEAATKETPSKRRDAQTKEAPSKRRKVGEGERKRPEAFLQDVFETDDEAANKETPSKRRHAQTKEAPTKRRRTCYSMHIVGKPVCERAARFLVGIGSTRMERIRGFRMDGRCMSNPNRNAKASHAMQRCTTFLWRMYHQVAEGMPDRFSFAKGDTKSATVAPHMSRIVTIQRTEILSADVDWSETEPMDESEQQDRAIAAIAASVAATHPADTKAIVGPGVASGPLRFLPPGKKIHLWWEFDALQRAQDRPSASFRVFCRALSKFQDQGFLKFRRVGSHAVCTECQCYKKELRSKFLPTARREHVMNKYTSHVVEQWLDRQVYDNVQDMSRSMFQCIREGRMLAASNLSTSVVAVIADGMDQAKFKVPRRLVQSHAFESLLRPALSVHGVWAHGAGYELGVADADLKKDTGCNIECIVRLLSGIKDRHGILPLGLHLQQDNTSRECKNQKWCSSQLLWCLSRCSAGLH